MCILLVPARQTSTIDRNYAQTKPFVYGGGATLTRTCSHFKPGFRILIRVLLSDPVPNFEKGRLEIRKYKFKRLLNSGFARFRILTWKRLGSGSGLNIQIQNSYKIMLEANFPSQYLLAEVLVQ